MRPTLAQLPVLLATAALTLAFTLGYLWNEDLGWYLASGERILDERAIPGHDDFLYSHGGAAGWVAHSWLWTVALAAVHRAAGTLGLAVLDALVVLGIILALALWLRTDRYALIGGSAALVVLLAGGARLLLRAELGSWLGLLAMLALLELRTSARWRLLAIVALQLLWANVHGGFLLGVFAVLTYAVARRVPLWTVAAVAGVSLLTPSGILPELQRAGYGFTAATASPVMEWRPVWLQLGTREPWLLLTTAVAAAATFRGVRGSTRMARALLLAGLTLAGIAAMRFVVAAVLGSVVVALLNLRDRQAAPRSSRTTAAAPVAAALFCAAVTTLAVGLWLARTDLEGGQSRGPVTLGPASTAPGAADYILAHELPGPVFNDMELGGDLAHRLYPHHRLFIDSRNLDLDLLRRYVRMLTSRDAWREAEAEFGFRTVVLSHLGLPGSLPLRGFLQDDPRWRRVYLDAQAVVFVRADDTTSAPTLLDPTRVPYLATGNSASRALRRVATRLFLRLDSDELLLHYLGVLGDLGETETLFGLSSAALERRPGELPLRRARGIAAVFSEREELAAADFATVLAHDAADKEARFLYALALERLQRSHEAAAQLDLVLEQDPAHAAARELRARIAARRALRE